MDGGAVSVVVAQMHVKEGREDEARMMVVERAPDLLRALPGVLGGYWARSVDGVEVVHHSFWLFDSEGGARRAASALAATREMPDAPAVLRAVDVCELIVRMSGVGR